jgi:hypothetical protein
METWKRGIHHEKFQTKFKKETSKRKAIKNYF